MAGKNVEDRSIRYNCKRCGAPHGGVNDRYLCDNCLKKPNG